MWDRLIFVLRVAAVIWVAAVAVMAVLQAYAIVPATPKLEPWAWVISLAVLGVDNLGTLFSRAVTRHRRNRNYVIQQALMTLLVDLAKPGDVRFEELGASVYRPSLADRVLRRGKEPRTFTRIVRFRPSGYPQQSGVAWGPSKGVVGICWSTRQECHKNVHAIADKWAGTEITEERFAKIPKDTKMGFDQREFQTIVGKYSEVLAAPIWHGRKDNRLVGVLSIDRSRKAQDDTFIAKLNNLGTREVSAATASVVARTLYPIREPSDG